MLAVNASVYNEDNLKIWLDNRQSRFLSPTVEVSGDVEGVDGVEYELRVGFNLPLAAIILKSHSIGHGSANYDEGKTLASGCNCQG